MALLVRKYTLVLMVGNDMESVLVRGQQFQVAIEIRALTIFCHGWLYAHGTLITASHASMRVLGVFIVVDASVICERNAIGMYNF